MKKSIIKALALATLALAFAFTAVSAIEIPNDGIMMVRSDIPHDHDIVT